MARPSDREYALHRKMRDLEEQCRNKDAEIEVLKKRISKLEGSETKVKKAKSGKPACPSCGAEVKDTALPFGRLILCAKACGYRETKR